MTSPLKVILCAMTACVSVQTETKRKGGADNIKCDSVAVQKTALVGDSVTVNCIYQAAEGGSVKHLCRETEGFSCTNLISLHNHTLAKSDRFYLRELKEQGLYTVMISELGQKDTGKYQCAVNHNSARRCLTRIHLNVEPGKKPKGSYSGKTVNIDCYYANNNTDDDKFLCKGESPLRCEVLVGTNRSAKSVTKDRFFIRDNQRLKYFYLNIKNSSADDSGTYWCGSTGKWQSASYSRVDLLIDSKGHNIKSSNQPTTATPSTSLHSNSIAGMVVVTLACLAVIVIVVVIVIIVYRCGRTQGRSTTKKTGENTEEDHGDRVYEEIQEQNQGTSSEAEPSMNVYHLLAGPTQQLHYTSIRFQQNGNTRPGTDRRDASACEYSSVRKTQADTHPPVPGPTEEP